MDTIQDLTILLAASFIHTLSMATEDNDVFWISSLYVMLFASVSLAYTTIPRLFLPEWASLNLVRNQEQRNHYIQIKYALDAIIVLLVLPLVLPIMAMIALAIYFQDGGSVLFVQERTGFQGRRFKMLKFRTMVPDAEKCLQDLAAQGLAVLDENGKLAQPLKLANDPRVTRIGRFLRKTSLDELPQLLNILFGDMSIVGPRPTSWGLDCYTEEQKARLVIRPGITGLWQVSDRGNKDFDSWLEWDMKYINGLSFSMDVQIIIQTILVVVKRKEIVVKEQHTNSKDTDMANIVSPLRIAS